MPVELTRTFTRGTYQQALEFWDFIDLTGKFALFTSPFGDVFFNAVDGIWWLDMLEGRLSRTWDTAEDLLAALNTKEGQDQYLLAGMALDAEAMGLAPDDDQILGFIIPPVLGGPIEVTNIELIDFVVGLDIAGQVHAQVRGLTPGARISGFAGDRESAPLVNQSRAGSVSGGSGRLGR